MLPLLLLRLRSLGWRPVAAVGLGGALLALLLTCWRQRQELQQLRLAYEHPRTVEVVREVRVQGPERVVVRVVREPGGRVETTSEVTRGPVVTTRDGAKTSEPVFPPAAPTSGWVLGLGTDRVASRQAKEAAVYGGFRLPGGRLDLLARADGRARLGVVVLWRF